MGLLLGIATILISCSNPGVPVKQVISANGDDFKVRFLFEVEGVKIYRFEDAGDYKYFSIGNNGKFLPQTQTRVINDGTQNNAHTYIKTWVDGVESK